MNIINFVAMVARMRSMQNHYFKFKDKESLIKAKILEYQVDCAIRKGDFFLPQERVISISNPIEGN